MKTVLNIKIDPKLKKQAQKVAASIGLPLGTVTNLLLKKFIEEKELYVAQSYRESFIPNARLRKIILQAEKDYKEGRLKGHYNGVDALMQSLRD